METRQLLTTNDIENMSRDEFVAFKSDRTKPCSLQKLCDANPAWVLINRLENIHTLDDLRHFTIVLKDDLWWQITHSAKTKGAGKSLQPNGN